MLQTMFWWIKVRKLDWPEIAMSLRSPVRFLWLLAALAIPYLCGIVVMSHLKIPQPFEGVVRVAWWMGAVAPLGVCCTAIWVGHAWSKRNAWKKETES